MPKDNQTIAIKLQQRRTAIKVLRGYDEASQTYRQPERPLIILECYGGFGIIYGRVWRLVRASGLVIEYNHTKARHLASQRNDDHGLMNRGNWIVVQARTEMAIAAGVGNWLPFNVIDCDPHGSPWDALAAYFAKPRAHQDDLYVVVTDGLPVLKTKVEPGRVNVLLPYIRKYGEMTVRKNYAAIAQELFRDITRQGGWEVLEFDYQQRPNEVAHWSSYLKFVGLHPPIP